MRRPRPGSRPQPGSARRTPGADLLVAVPAVVLVMAKAPVPGRVKTRLAADVGADVAAHLAATALLDTLSACERAFAAGRRYLALVGDLSAAARGHELAARLGGWHVVVQRGEGLARRIAHAHEDVATAARAPVVQIGMDTPQVTPRHLGAVVRALDGPRTDAVLGPAADGGWWALAVRDPMHAAAVAEVPMSTDRTCGDTEAALVSAGARVVRTVTLRDVDTVADAEAVARQAPGLGFSTAWRAATTAHRSTWSEGGRHDRPT